MDADAGLTHNPRPNVVTDSEEEQEPTQYEGGRENVESQANAIKESLNNQQPVRFDV
jgi:hypothetical protein